MRRVRLDLAYDGTEFAGWARQPGQRTVQQVLEEAVASVLSLDEPVVVTCAGRTDAGVHARGQVAHADLPDRVDPQVLAGGLRARLPEDVTVTACAVAPAGFDARFSALSRAYRYRCCDDPAAWDPLLRREVVRVPRALDLPRMNEAARPLLGEHDFAALCRPREGGTTIRRLLSLDWSREGGIASMAVVADAFCHSMVRSLVGLLLPVGEGRQPVGWPGAVVTAGVRDSRVTVMPARGLVLERVDYPDDDQLEARQAVTRTVRGG